MFRLLHLHDPNSIWVINCLLPLLFLATAHAVILGDRCETLRAKMCENLAYNNTHVTDSLRSQEDAQGLLSDFAPLVKVKCHPSVRFFLCTAVLPVCVQSAPPRRPFVIQPCREFCQTVKAGCLPVMRKFGYDWPDVFRCNKFPSKSGGHEICVDSPKKKEDESPPPTEKRELGHPVNPNPINADSTKIPLITVEQPPIMTSGGRKEEAASSSGRGGDCQTTNREGSITCYGRNCQIKCAKGHISVMSEHKFECTEEMSSFHWRKLNIKKLCLKKVRRSKKIHCTSGHVLVRNKKCALCPQGSVVDGEGTRCVDCPVGTRKKTMNATTCSPCHPRISLTDCLQSSK